jgi:hypothetical protein
MDGDSTEAGRLPRGVPGLLEQTPNIAVPAHSGREAQNGLNLHLIVK